MKCRSVPTIITLSSMLLLAQSGTLLVAADHSHVHGDGHEAEYETHDAHEHGRATLTLVADSQELSLQLESPAMNIVGFEHAAKTKEHHQKVERALSALSEPSKLFIINGGKCQFIEPHMENPFSLAENKHGEHDSHENNDSHTEHDEHEDHHEHEAHETHESHDEHAKEAEHREFVVEYNAICQLTNDIREIDVQLLKLFHGIEQLDVQYIYAGKQGAVSLNPKQTVLEF